MYRKPTLVTNLIGEDGWMDGAGGLQILHFVPSHLGHELLFPSNVGAFSYAESVLH